MEESFPVGRDEYAIKLSKGRPGLLVTLGVTAAMEWNILELQIINEAPEAAQITSVDVCVVFVRSLKQKVEIASYEPWTGERCTHRAKFIQEFHLVCVGLWSVYGRKAPWRGAHWPGDHG